MDRSVIEAAGTERINDEISLTLVEPSQGQVQLNHPIYLVVQNNTSTRLTFPPDFGNQVYALSDLTSRWHEVENRTNYVPADKAVILDVNGEIPRDIAGISVLPMVDDTSSYSRVRILVVGELEGGEVVAAYIDLELTGQ